MAQHESTLNSTRRSSASIASSVPVPTRILARADAARDDAAPELRFLPFQPSLNKLGAQHGEAFVQRLGAGSAAVPPYLQTSIGPQRPYGDLLYPKTIGFADFRVGPKCRRSWSKQELYRETPRTQAIIDDIAERLRGRRTTAEPPVGEINAVVHAQLIASRQAPSVQIEVKCFLVAARVIGCDGIR